VLISHLGVLLHAIGWKLVIDWADGLIEELESLSTNEAELAQLSQTPIESKSQRKSAPNQENYLFLYYICYQRFESSVYIKLSEVQS
jgi:hypothetical protein